MAKKNASTLLLDTLRDPRVVTMTPAAQTVWIRVVAAMQNSKISVMRFGSDIMNQTGIALFIQIAEAELEANLQPIIDRGLLLRDADGALVCPMLAEIASRSKVNTINGSKGGRPRKDGTPPRQRSMLFGIQGGAAETEITETVTETVTDLATEPPETPTYLLSKSLEEEKVSGVSDIEFHEIGRAALHAAGFDPARSMATYGLVRQWLADGADRDMILDVITRKTKPGVSTLAYFTAAIRDAVALKPAIKPAWERRYERAMANWELTGRGCVPMPNLADFKERVAA